jgi:hypothetical protein
MEVVRADFIMDDINIAGGATAASITAAISTRDLDVSVSSAPLKDPAAFAYANWDVVVGSLSGIALSTRVKTDRLDLSAGRGYLVATDQIWLGLSTQNTGRANTITVKIYYRMKNITLEEYIGIVQGQQ